MQNSLLRLRASSAWRLALIIAGATFLAGCATGGSGGDFGEIPQSLVRDGVHDWIGPEAVAERHAKPSNFQLTDDERHLRDLAYPFIEPPYRRQKWNSVYGEYGASKTFQAVSADRTLYSKFLLEGNYRSSSARYAHLLDDINDDDKRLPDFYATATRVIDIDAKRRESLHYITDLPPLERANALRRIHENAAIVSLVATRLRQRVKSYRYALEQLVVRTPSSEAATVELALNDLKADIARYEQAPTPTWVREKSLASNG